MSVTGLGVSSLILPRIGCPQPGFLVSTTATPFAITNTAVLPPPPSPRSTKRLSLSFSTSTTRGFSPAPPAGGCWCAVTVSDSAPTATRPPRTADRVIVSPSLLGKNHEPFVFEQRNLLRRLQADFCHHRRDLLLTQLHPGVIAMAAGAGFEVDDGNPPARFQVAGEVLEIGVAVLDVMEHVVDERKIDARRQQGIVILGEDSFDVRHPLLGAHLDDVREQFLVDFDRIELAARSYGRRQRDA